MAVEIYIARHGQNEDNVNGILNGHRDLPLTELGIRQAEELAEGIVEAQLSFDHIFSSPLQRAYKTAEIIAEKLEHTDKPEVLQSLIERDFGTASGKPITEAVASAGDNVIKTDTITYILDFEKGEPFPEVLKRAEYTLDYVRHKYSNGSVLLVCHGDIGKMLYASATGKDWIDVLVHFHFGNCDLIDVNSHEAHKIKLDQHNL